MSFKNYINGEWVGSDNTIPNVNPSDTSDIIGGYCQATPAQVDDAIDAADAALAQWANSTPQQRFDVLDGVGNELKARAEELGELLAREEGKLLAEGIGEIIYSANIFKFYAAEALRMSSEFLQSTRPGITIEVNREPVGVVGAICPWNFPLAIPARKVAPALAFGNTVVLKPANLTPALSWEMVDILARYGLPAGVCNLVMGSGAMVGDKLSRSDKVRAITFTGSTEVGRQIRELAANRGAKVQLEMGGKSPLIVLDDADLDNAINAAIGGSIFQVGQRCTSNTRIIATPGIYEALAEGMAKMTAGLKVGHALAADSQLGPVASESQMNNNFRYIDIADNEGAERLCGGERLQLEHNGFYMSPVVYAGCHNQMQHVREEIFGPVVSVLQVDDYEQAVAVANDSPFALSSGICTTSQKCATDFKRRSDSGVVTVNLPTAGVDYHAPFGGRKGSSYGAREMGRTCIEFFTDVKTAYNLPL